MASSKEYRDFILEQLSLAGDITFKPMMGEYLLYKSGVLVGGVYDDRLLIKITANNGKFDLETALPYDGAKPMYFVDDLEDKEKLAQIIRDTYGDLK